MKIYAVHIDIEGDDPNEYFPTLKAALAKRAGCGVGYGGVELLETSPDMTPREVIIAMLNETGWVAKRTEIKPDKTR